jgi:amino acid transporter
MEDMGKLITSKKNLCWFYTCFGDALTLLHDAKNGLLTSVKNPFLFLG